MDKHSKRSASIFRYPVLMAFTLFFAGLFVLDLVTPDRAYSELENTTLSQRPSLSSVSADGLNKFFTAYTKYVKDQVAGRDNWVALQSTVETKVMQKEQSGGILLGKQHMMFPRTYGLVSSETRTLPKNTAALEALCQRYPGKVNVMLVPAASAIYPANVPAGAPLLDEDCYLDSLSNFVTLISLVLFRLQELYQKGFQQRNFLFFLFWLPKNRYRNHIRVKCCSNKPCY